jgi:hypothetical protein
VPCEAYVAREEAFAVVNRCLRTDFSHLPERLAVLAAGLLVALAAGAQGFPQDDGFVYPGQPGSTGVGEYYRRWAEHVAALPAPTEGRPAALRAFEWMTGRWTVVARDYDFSPGSPGRIVEVGRGSATVAFTPDERWLRIESTLTDRVDLKFIGFNRAARQLVLQQVVAPGITYPEPVRSPGWRGERITFGPAPMVHYGARYTDRITVVREGPDAFRVVVEGDVGGGRFVAMDDLVFSREGGPPRP